MYIKFEDMLYSYVLSVCNCGIGLDIWSGGIIIGVGRYWRLGAEYTIAREAHAKFYDHAYFVSNHTHFCMIKAVILMKKWTVGQVE